MAAVTPSCMPPRGTKAPRGGGQDQGTHPQGSVRPTPPPHQAPPPSRTHTPTGRGDPRPTTRAVPEQATPHPDAASPSSGPPHPPLRTAAQGGRRGPRQLPARGHESQGEGPGGSLLRPPPGLCPESPLRPWEGEEGPPHPSVTSSPGGEAYLPGPLRPAPPSHTLIQGGGRTSAAAPRSAPASCRSCKHSTCPFWAAA